jgi:aryl-alcohol dehydrogenase-like predicted oxidoreductase
VTPRLGRDGPELTRFGLGMAALGRPAYITIGHQGDLPEGHSVEAVEAHAHRVLDRAWASGIRYFDAARSYGHAERFLRAFFESRKIKPKDVVVGSKWGYRYTGDWAVDGRVQEVKDHGVAMLRAQAAESTSILGPYLRLYQIHSAAPETRVLENEPVISDLLRLREHGVQLGLTTTGPSQLETVRRAIDLRFDGRPLFTAVQATWNIMERSAEAGLREAHDAGFTVLVKEALANGRLTSRGDAGQAGPLRAVSTRMGLSPDVVALAFVAMQSWADVILIGAATEEQLDSNLRAGEVAVSPEDLRALEAMRVPPELYWSRRAALPWN